MKPPLLALAFFFAGLFPMMTATARPVTIMPLGDSITEGDESFSVYRYPLLEKLRAAGYDVVYVGSKTTQSQPNSPLGVLRHEGHSGKNSAFIREHFEAAYRENPADVILLHAGHNQFSDRKPIPGLLADMRGIITAARAINPKVTILLGQVITSGKLPKYDYIPAFNAALAPLAAELNTPAQPVILVDHATGFDWQTDTIADRVHPNAQGAEKMAANWFATLQKILPPPTQSNARQETPSAAPPSPFTLRLWTGDAPGLRADPGPEIAEANDRVSNVSVPTLDVYLPPPDKANGIAILICSGGGYTRLASGPLGRGAADIFGPRGYTVFSLKYRTRPPSTDAPRDALADARQALRIIRSRAAEWRIDPERVGMVGFSAGANLILNLATAPDTANPRSADPLARQSTRPNFVGLAATWPSSQKLTDFAINANTPPAFIAHTRDDASAPFAFGEQLAAAWKRAGSPVEFHGYETGGHMAFNFPNAPVAEWTTLFEQWVRKPPLRR